MSRQVKRSIDLSHLPQRTRKQQLLCEAIEQDLQELQRGIQVYIRKVIQQFGSKFDKTCDRYSVETVAQEILHETVKTALTKAEEFDLNRSPRPWLLTIAAYKIKEWKRDQTRKSNRVIPIAELTQASKIKHQLSSERLSEEEILGLLYQSSESFESDRQQMLEYLTSLAKDDDKELLKLVFDGFDGKYLAGALGISEGAAYTRKSRLIKLLRQAHAQANSEEEGR